jgi:DNA-binding transcriptional regulator YiaG
MSGEDWRERAAYVHRQIAFIRELLARDKIRAAEGKRQKKKDDERLKKVVELSADTHQRIRNLLKIVQGVITHQLRTAKQRVNY